MGLIIGLVPPALIATLDGGISEGVLVVVVYSVLNVVIQTILQPVFTGDAVGLTSTVCFLSLLFWGFVLGPLGALVSVPATSLAKAVLVDADPSARWINAFMATDYEGRPPRRPSRRDARRRRLAATSPEPARPAGDEADGPTSPSTPSGASTAPEDPGPAGAQEPRA